MNKKKNGNDKNSKKDDSPSGALPFLSKKQFEMLKQYMTGGKSTKPQTLKKGGKAKKMMAKGGAAGGMNKRAMMMGGGKTKKMMKGGGKTKKYMAGGGKTKKMMARGGRAR